MSVRVSDSETPGRGAVQLSAEVGVAVLAREPTRRFYPEDKGDWKQGSRFRGTQVSAYKRRLGAYPPVPLLRRVFALVLPPDPDSSTLDPAVRDDVLCRDSGILWDRAVYSGSPSRDQDRDGDVSRFVPGEGRPLTGSGGCDVTGLPRPSEIWGGSEESPGPLPLL